MKPLYTVSELSRIIKQKLEDSFPDVWVEGEISNFTQHTSGHMYFTLKDEGAQMQVVMFRHLNQSLTFQLTGGLKVVIRGHISVYEKRGSYQLYAQYVEPKGKGALQLAFEQLKAKLAKEGLFDEVHKKMLPVFPQVIGVITSPTGAAIRDILQIVDRRFSNVHIILRPVKVQGAGAREEIAQAIDEMNEYGKCDCLIVGRGGGSIEDLWAFNEEGVARAIFRSRIPIISAVGHEIDYTISDFVADMRAPTPSAAAELVITRKEAWVEKIDTFRERLKSVVDGMIDARRQRLTALMERYAFRHPYALLEQRSQRLDDTLRRLGSAMKISLDTKRHILKQSAGKLQVLSPLGVLARGYSVTRDDAKKTIIKRVSDVSVGNTIETTLHKGSFRSKVVSVKS